MRDVEAVVGELADHDEAGLVVAACWYDVSNDRPNYLMSQFDVQNFLWLTLPQLLRDPPADLDPMPDWQAIVDEAAWFFERLDQPRYAAICRGPRTSEILASSADALHTFELYAKATHASGIMPPPGLRITWLDEPGPREVALYDAVTRALERAIASGDLDPTDEAQRLAVAVAVLDQPPDGHTESLHELMLAERMALLRRTCGSQTVRELLVRIEPDVAKPLDLTPDLLLANTHTLAGALRDPTEDGQHRALAEKLGLLTTTDGVPSRTTAGDQALNSPPSLFDALVTGLANPPDRITNQAALPLLAMLLLADRIDRDMLLDRVTNVFYESGWRGDAHDQPMPPETVERAITELLTDMRTAGVITIDQERLTEFGRAVAHTGVRIRAMRGGQE
jgi:hypothetical protein